MKKNKLIIITILLFFIVALLLFRPAEEVTTASNDIFVAHTRAVNTERELTLLKSITVGAKDRTEELKELQKLLNLSNSKQYSESTKVHKNSELYTVGTVEYRVGAGNDYETVGTLSEDTKVQTTGVTHNGWYQCNIDGQIVYIYADNLEEKKIEIMATGTKAEYQKYAYSLFADYGWSDDEFDPLVRLWTRESNWSPSAHNSSSGAHGIPQSLPASKMASEGDDYYTNGYTQIRWGLKYISQRYGTPSNAWAHSERTGWY